MNPNARRWLQSTGTILLGLFAIVGLSLVTDQILHMLNVYPPWGQPMRATSQNLVALSYRLVYGVLGSYLAAKFAPRNPMRHALFLGILGTALSLAGAIATLPMDLGPKWFPISLVITAMPCAWLGGLLYREKMK